MPDEPLNLIVITSDEMRGDCPGYMGNPDCRTPNLDRFAEKGVAFMRHFSVFPKCVPTRIAAMTGRYCHTDGFRTIHQHLPNDHPDVLATLKAHGYESALFGINHCWENVYGDPLNKKGTGYTDYQSFTEDYFQHMLEREWHPPEPPEDAPEPMETPEGTDFHYRGRKTEPRTGFCDDNRAEEAIHYLTEVRDRSRPFFMQLNLSLPHPAYAVEEPYYSMYDRDAIQPWPHDLPENAPLHMRRMREVRSGEDPPEALLREIQAVYYGMITKTDMLIGRVLDAIEAEGLLQNTVVLFFVDHGDFAGQYALPEKWDTCMADCLLHVPCILWAPGLPEGERVEELTQHVDFPRTLLGLLGIEPDWGIHGRNLVSIMRGEERREAAFADGGHEEEMQARMPKDARGSGKQVTYAKHPETMARAKMVRTKRWKLVTRLTGGNELYDMENDRYEMRNLWDRVEDDPELQRVVLDLQQRMIDWCTRTDTDRPYQGKVGA